MLLDAEPVSKNGVPGALKKVARVLFLPSETPGTRAELPRRVEDVVVEYRYRKVSEWLFDVAFRMLMNFGNWVMSLALALKAGYSCFHDQRDRFADQRRRRPPIWVTEDEDRRLKEKILERSRLPGVDPLAEARG